MNKEEGRQDYRLKNISQVPDAAKPNNDKDLIEVKKKDTAADSDNNFVVYEEPFDEQMRGAFRDKDDTTADKEEGD